MSLLSEVTIVIPTHYRHKYLTRVLAYYKNINIQVLVADSTDVEYVDKNKFDIIYVHYPNGKLLDKLFNIINQVKTKYMFFCADDDFWVQESILPCVDFLNKNIDYSSVQGNYIGFTGHNKDDFIPSYLHASSIEANGVEERLAESMDNYMPLFYAIHRTDIIQKVFADSMKNNISHAILNELSVALYSLIYGKHKKLNILTYVRDDISDPTPVQRDNLKVISEKDELKAEYIQFKSNIRDLILGQDRNSDATKIVDRVLSIYIDKIKTANNSQGSIFRELMKKIFFFTKPLVLKYREKKYKQDILLKTSSFKGYPHSDVKTNKEWLKICEILKKYDIK